MTQLRDHTFLGLTQSLYPDCLALVPAKIITEGSPVYFRKRCPDHGVREDFICSDVSQYDQMQYSLPGDESHRSRSRRHFPHEPAASAASRP